MSKRKQNPPQKIDPEKVKSLSWNLSDCNDNNLEVNFSEDSGVLDTAYQSSSNFDESTNDEASTSYTFINQSIISAESTPKSTSKKKKRSRSAYEDIDPNLKDIIDDCDFYITVYRYENVKKDIHCHLGSFSISLQDINGHTDDLPEYQEYWIYVSTIAGKNIVYFEWQEDKTRKYKYYLLSSLPPYRAMSSFQNKKNFVLTHNNYSTTDRILTLNVFVLETGIMKLKYSSDDSRRPNQGTQALMEFLYGIEPPAYSEPKRKKHDIDSLYANIKEFHASNVIPDYDVQHPSLLPKLRPYQKAAVNWMINQEVKILEDHSKKDELSELYEEVKTPDGIQLYYNKFGGYLVSKKPCHIPSNPGGILADEMGLGKTVEVLACVLCNPRKQSVKNYSSSNLLQNNKKDDETVNPESGMEVLSDGLDDETDNECYYTAPSEMSSDSSSEEIFSTKPKVQRAFGCVCGASSGGRRQKCIQCTSCHIWQHAACVKYDGPLGSYFCPHCCVTRPPIPSNATLIVAPASIKYQWLEEIQRHLNVDQLKIEVYTGVHKQGFIQPQTLASYDIVVTTYETLSREIHYVDLPHSNSESGRKFRSPKRFMAIPSPLIAVEWWRICLDEAQMVECVTKKTAEMALKLSAINRWCVTGTPIQKSIEDLYGLLLFLGAYPYCVRTWWLECLYKLYCCDVKEPMQHVIRKYLWRTSKKDVVNQINIPSQREELHWLRFTPVEEHFYRQQHLVCSRDAVTRIKKLSNMDVKLNSLDRQTLHQLLAPVLNLRQACCHPQAVRGQFISIQKCAMTMDELLDSLIKKTKTETEEAHRLHIAALNGLAGIYIIKEQWKEAVEKYREVLQLAEEYQSQIKTDRLQKLHALHNLAMLLDAGHSNIPPTLRDSSLKEEAKNLRNDYLVKCAAKVKESQVSLQTAQEVVKESMQLFKCNVPWWSTVLNNLISLNTAEDLVDRIRNELQLSIGHKKFSLANRFTDARGLQYTITTELDDLEEAHRSLSKAVRSLNPTPSESEVNSAVECHLRPVEKRTKKCIYCTVDELFQRYEAKLYSYNDAQESLNEEPSTTQEALMSKLRRGTWADGDTEKILKLVYCAAKSSQCSTAVADDGNSHMKLFDSLKKEFKALRAVWKQITDQVSSIDELNMATIRMRLRLPGEPIPKEPLINVLEPTEIDHHAMKLASDRVIAQNDMRKKLGQLLYLQNLSKSDYGRRGGSNPEPCPICQRALGEQWSVLQCGHCFCIECIRILITDYSIGGRKRAVKCAVCRQIISLGEISYVNTKFSEVDQESIAVQGSHSTKVEAVVRTLLKIKKDDPDAKALVFSTWQDVLDIIENALVQNDVKFCRLYSHSHYKFQANLASFKYDPEISVLLLPVLSGANGLNLIEATHVLIVEPILNPASDLQAIGRIHRIGQTKPTVVHRFLVHDTIEQRIHETLKSHCISLSTHDTEENPLTVRSLFNLFTVEEEV